MLEVNQTVEVVENLEPEVCNDTETSGKKHANKLKTYEAVVSCRNIVINDYKPYPSNIKLYVNGDKDKLWAISVGYTYDGQIVDAADSHVYKLIQYKGTQATTGALKLDIEALEKNFNDVRQKVQESSKSGVAYNYKSFLPIAMFAHKQGSQCGGIIETRDGNGIVTDISHRRWDPRLYYFSELANEIWNVSNAMSVRNGRIITKTIKAFTNDPSQDALMLCIIDKYIKGQMFHEEDMLAKYKTPAWDEWMDRYDKKSQEYIMAWIWALVYQKSNNCEILWIRSEGGDGKTTFVNALKSGLSKIMIFGNNSTDDDEDANPFSVSITDSTSAGLKDPFITSRVYDKRLVYIPECKNPKILSTSLIHQLSGGETDMAVNQKFEKVFAVKPMACVLICSNDYPKIDNQKNELRRLLFISPREDYVHKDIKDDTFEGRLSSEVDTLLYKCKFYYDKCIKRGNGYIQPPSETLEWITSQGIMIDSSDHNYDLLFEKGSCNDKLSFQDIQRSIDYANQELKGRVHFNFDQRAVQVYFKDTFGITKMSSTKRSINGKVVKAYQGVKLRSATEIIDLIDAQTNNGTCPMPVISEDVF